MITVGVCNSKGHKSGLLTLFPVFPQTFLRTLQNAIRTEQSQEDAIWHSRVFSFYLQRNTTGTVCSYSEMETKSLHNIFSASQPVPHLSVSRGERKQMKKMERRSNQNLGTGKSHLLRGQKKSRWRELGKKKYHKLGSRTKPWRKVSPLILSSFLWAHLKQAMVLSPSPFISSLKPFEQALPSPRQGSLSLLWDRRHMSSQQARCWVNCPMVKKPKFLH